MATEILAIGTAAADSADVVVAGGTQLTVGLKDASGADWVAGRVTISLKADNNEYFVVDELNTGKNALVIVGAGTYRFSRIAGASCGVFSA